jgi:hypothetical protein
MPGLELSAFGRVRAKSERVKARLFDRPFARSGPLGYDGPVVGAYKKPVPRDNGAECQWDGRDNVAGEKC